MRRPFRDRKGVAYVTGKGWNSEREKMGKVGSCSAKNFPDPNLILLLSISIFWRSSQLGFWGCWSHYRTLLHLVPKRMTESLRNFWPFVSGLVQGCETASGPSCGSMNFESLWTSNDFQCVRIQCLRTQWFIEVPMILLCVCVYVYPCAMMVGFAGKWATQWLPQIPMHDNHTFIHKNDIDYHHSYYHPLDI